MSDNDSESCECIQIEKLFNQLLEQGYVPFVQPNGYEVIECKGIQIRTLGNRFVPLTHLSRHKTSKHLLEIHVKSDAGEDDVTVTTDHVCMIYDKDHFFQNAAAKDLHIGQYVSVYDEFNDRELFGQIVKVVDIGQTSDWMYDCEVDDECHAFYADNIYVHNSQFINLQCVSDYVKQKNGLKGTMYEWPKKYKREVWDIMTKLTDEKINPFVRDLAANYCYTSQKNVLTYELEYMTDRALFESKKHYFIHQCIVEGDDEDHVKVSGIELKKASVPKEMKRFLEEVYLGIVLKGWEEKDYQKYINDLYNEFTKFNVNEVAFWKGYSTAREAEGFLQMQLGTTGISKSVTFYNQIIQKLGLGGKYPEIIVGNMVRQVYLKSSNKYGIETIAFLPDQWPKEFDELFEIDYVTMFNKLILDPLRNMRKACHLRDHDPSKQVEFDVFDL